MISKFYKSYLSLLKYFLIISLIATLIVLVKVSYNSYVFLVLFALIGIFISLITENRDISITSKIIPVYEKKYKLITNIVFYILLTFLILSLTFDAFSKPFIFYVLLSFCSALIGLEIFLFTGKDNPNSILIKCYILCIILFFSNQIVYPLGIGGSDSYSHFSTIQGILKTNYIPEGAVYASFPFHHILVSINSIISSLEYRILYYTIGTFLMSLNLLVAYLIGSKFLNQKFGLIVALIYPFNDYILFWSTHGAQLTYVLPLMLFLFAVILFKIKKPCIGYSIVSLIFIFSIIFAHHYSSMIFIFILLSLFVGEELSHFKIGNGRKSYNVLFLIFIVALLIHWMYYSNLLSTFSNIIEAYINAFSADALREGSSIAQATRYDNLPLSTLFLNTLGSNIILMLSAYGFFLFAKKRTMFCNTINILLIIFSILIVLGIFIDLHYLLPNRLYAFMQLFGLLFLSSETIFLIQKKARGYNIFIILYILILLLVPFFSTSSTIAGFETSLFTGNQPYVKLFETPQEIYSQKWVESRVPENYILYPSGSIYPSSLYSLAAKEKVHQVKDKIPISNDGEINLSKISTKSIIFFSDYDISIGYPYASTNSSSMGSGIIIKTSENVSDTMELYPNLQKIYTNCRLSIYCTLEE